MAEPEPKTIRYHYLKSSDFRVIHADGVYGGLSPRGYLQLGFFSERSPFPQMVDHEFWELDQNRVTVGKEVRRIGREGVVRELETMVMLDLEGARTLQKWLASEIDRMARAHELSPPSMNQGEQ